MIECIITIVVLGALFLALRPIGRDISDGRHDKRELEQELDNVKNGRSILWRPEGWKGQ